jgi:hypothetical protein
MAPAASITDVCEDRAPHCALAITSLHVTPEANERDTTDGTIASPNAAPRALRCGIYTFITLNTLVPHARSPKNLLSTLEYLVSTL